MGRGNYAKRACNYCRKRKSKCDGVEPRCGPCTSLDNECSWGPESAKRSINKQYVDSLKALVRQLDKRVKVQQSHIAALHAAGGSKGDVSPLPDIPHLDEHLADDRDDEQERGSPGSDETLVKAEEQEDADIEQLIAPTRHLHFEDGDTLQLYGPTSIFRLAPRYQPNAPSRYQDIASSDGQSYQLLSNDGGSHPVHQNIDWDRHLPADVPLSRPEHDKILDLMFRFFTSWCLRVIPELFLLDMHRSLSVPRSQPTLITAHYSPLLHNALMAVGSAFSDDPGVRNEAARRKYADKARDCLEVECERPKLSAVIGLSILANYHSSQGSPTLGYMYFGISARLSQALGLALDCSPWVRAGLITEPGMLDRNWVFWTTFCQDTTWSLYVGRDFCVSSLSDVHRIPVPFVDTKFDQIPWHWPPGENKRPNYLSRTFAATSDLLHIARQIMDVVSNFSRLGVRQEANDYLIAQMDLKLSTWKENLTPEVDLPKSSYAVAMPHQLMLHMTHCWLAIVLHRPFYRRRSSNDDSGSEEDHIKPCNRAAQEIMDLADSWRKQFTLRYVPITFIQVVSAAGTIFILSAVQATAGPRIAHHRLAAAQHNAKMAIQYLLEVGASFASARGIADILNNLLEEQVNARLARRSPGGAPSGSRRQQDVSPPTSDENPYSWSNAPSIPAMGSAVPYFGGDNSPSNDFEAYGFFTDAQQTSDYSFAAYGSVDASSSTMPIPAPLNYHQPFGSGVEEYSENFSFPTMGMGVGMLPGDAVFPNDPLMMFNTGPPAQPDYMSYHQHGGAPINYATRMG
ncbi:hypothetical protein BV25DRAFT_1920908 [Artomyces pyxidatus]|uniref:Uncharacterized protein n=1 Tax=Artomyces pyxidatus TaxID=48021 RepID=A0ACB8SK18_9AGAM|nr:hypothetical protein BV25DRAFT_1920908 [Artomyces pyxidatus]